MRERVQKLRGTHWGASLIGLDNVANAGAAVTRAHGGSTHFSIVQPCYFHFLKSLSSEPQSLVKRRLEWSPSDSWHQSD